MNAALITTLTTSVVSIIGAVTAAVIAIRGHVNTNASLVNALHYSQPTASPTAPSIPVKSTEGIPT